MATHAEPARITEENIHYAAVPKSEQNGHDSEQENKEKLDSPPQLRRFPIRALFLIIIPPALAAYFIVVQTVLTSPEPDAAPYGHRNAKWVFYSWFLLGVWGLSMSSYGLKGVEAAMLQHKFWAPRNSQVLSMHVEGSWTSLGGWIRLTMSLIKREGTPAQLVGWLWALLATLSLAMYVALPLSGLAMELKDGYIQGSGHPKVLGRTWFNYNVREPNQEAARGKAMWMNGAPMALPGAGILYSNGDTDRAQDDSLKKLPNSFPLEGGFLDVFLGPQAENPVKGNAWGVRLGYKCNVVKSKSEFTILSQRSSNLNQSWLPPSHAVADNLADNIFYTPDNKTITFWTSGVPRSVSTTWAYGETGQTPTKLNDDGMGSYVWDNATSFDEESLRKNGSVIEIALWQIRRKNAYEGLGAVFDFNSTLEPSIGDMGGPFFLDKNKRLILNESFIPKNLHLLDKNKFNFSAIIDAPTSSSQYIQNHIQNGTLVNNIVAIPPPIGVRCLYQFAPGYADLNPESASFSSFVASPPPPIGAEYRYPTFGLTMSRIMNQTYFDMYTAMGATPLIYSNSAIFTSYINPVMLLGSVMRGFAMDALELMYDGANSFIASYEHENLTATNPGKILAPGEVPIMIPTVLFCIWAAGCVLLGVMYGFQRRRAETMGADLAQDIRRGMAPSAGLVARRSDFKDNL